MLWKLDTDLRAWGNLQVLRWYVYILDEGHSAEKMVRRVWKPVKKVLD